MLITMGRIEQNTCNTYLYSDFLAFEFCKNSCNHLPNYHCTKQSTLTQVSSEEQ